MKPLGDNVKIKILLVLSRAGTLDHAVSLNNQLTLAGASVDYLIAKSGVVLPDWAKTELSNCREISAETIQHLSKTYTAVWFQEPYEELFSSEMKDILTTEFVIYSGYGLPMTNWTRGLFGLPFFSLCGLITTASPYFIDCFQENKNSPEKIIWTGDPFLFELINSSSYPAANKSKKILWAPHWSDSWVDGTKGFSRWRETVGPLLEFFETHPKTDLIIRGHPLLDTSARGDIEFLQKLKKLQSLGNVQISTSSMMNDIKRSDALISDGVSIIAYFGATGKPVGFVEDIKYKPPFSSAGQAISKSGSTLSTPKEINNWLRGVAEDIDQFAFKSKESKDLVLQLFPIHKSSPGSQIVRFLINQTK
jgi:hypothetical protein